MKRRTFLGVLGGALGGAAAWPAVVRAQQQGGAPVIGFINSRPQSEKFIAAFRQGLEDSGYPRSDRIVIDYHGSEGRNEVLSMWAADMVRRQVALIVTGGGAASAIAAKAATSTIPIVFIGGSDPVATGLVASINRPGGNATGILNVASALTAKRLELLREFAPRANTVAVLHNPNYPEFRTQLMSVEELARSVGLKVHVAPVSRDGDFAPAVDAIARHAGAMLFVANDPYIASQRNQLIALAARHAIPATYAQREYAEAGGLMSYGTNFAEVYRLAGVYAGRILKGEKPADLPVMQPSRFELVINLKTAKALKIDVPAKLLALADDVIE
jgi:putative ABC transport system substrate-binding protein